jgi:hypothetical protein
MDSVEIGIMSCATSSTVPFQKPRLCTIKNSPLQTGKELELATAYNNARFLPVQSVPRSEPHQQ